MDGRWFLPNVDGDSQRNTNEDPRREAGTGPVFDSRPGSQPEMLTSGSPSNPMWVIPILAPGDGRAGMVAYGGLDGSSGNTVVLLVGSPCPLGAWLAGAKPVILAIEGLILNK